MDSFISWIAQFVALRSGTASGQHAKVNEVLLPPSNGTSEPNLTTRGEAIHHSEWTREHDRRVGAITMRSNRASVAIISSDVGTSATPPAIYGAG